MLKSYNNIGNSLLIWKKMKKNSLFFFGKDNGFFPKKINFSVLLFLNGEKNNSIINIMYYMSPIILPPSKKTFLINGCGFYSTIFFY